MLGAPALFRVGGVGGAAPDPNVISLNSPTVHPLAVAGTDFQFANKAALLDYLAIHFPDDTSPNGYTRNDTPGTLVDFAGGKALRMDEMESGFSVSKILTGGPRRMFMRNRVYVPPSPPGWLEDAGAGPVPFSAQISVGDIADSLDYNWYSGPYTEISRPPGGFGSLNAGANVPGPYWTDNIQGKTSNWLTLFEAGADPSTDAIRMRLWCNGGAAIEDDSTAGVIPAVTAWNIIELQPACVQHAPVDAVNNYALFRLAEWVPWPDGDPCPYSGITL